MSKVRAMYVGSFDPVTTGHLDIISRASRMFGHLVVAIGHNMKKPGLFDISEREQLLKIACKSMKNVSIKSFSGLTADFALAQDCDVLVRGLRDAQDFGFELQMAHMNHHLAGQIDTVFVPCLQQYSNISSSLVKEVAMLLGSDTKKLKGLVPSHVELALKKKFKK